MDVKYKYVLICGSIIMLGLLSVIFIVKLKNTQNILEANQINTSVSKQQVDMSENVSTDVDVESDESVTVLSEQDIIDSFSQDDSFNWLRDLYSYAWPQMYKEILDYCKDNGLSYNSLLLTSTDVQRTEDMKPYVFMECSGTEYVLLMDFDSDKIVNIYKID